MKGQNSPQKLKVTFLKIFFLDETIFVKVVVFYFAQTEQKKKNVSNNKHLHQDARAWTLNAEQDIASALKEHIEHKSFYTQQCIAVTLYLFV